MNTTKTSNRKPKTQPRFAHIKRGDRIYRKVGECYRLGTFIAEYDHYPAARIKQYGQEVIVSSADTILTVPQMKALKTREKNDKWKQGNQFFIDAIEGGATTPKALSEACLCSLVAAIVKLRTAKRLGIIQ